MIGKITGIIDYVADDHALIEAAGVGYIVYCAPGTLAALPAAGQVASLYTELLVREDLLQLIGFRTVAEREWHRLLTTVQGVGAKAALSILGVLGADGVSRAIALGDSTSIRRAPGVGPKLAQRIAHELQDKAPAVMALGAQASRLAVPRGSAAAASPSMPPPDAAVSAAAADAAATADALSALVNLGYDRSEAARAVAEAAHAAHAADAPTAETLIKAALKALAPAL